MKNLLLILLGSALGAGALFGILRLSPAQPEPPVVADSAAPAAKPLWTCGMHPQILQDHPGDCPICGMKLTPVRKQAGGDGAAAADDHAIRIDPVTAQNMNLRTGTVITGPLRRTVRTVGTIDYDETSLAEVTTKFKGWIEKLYVDSTGTLVHKGDTLFDIYAPELYNAQVEYLLAMQAGAGSETMKLSALTKLKFFDIPDEQIARLAESKTPAKTVPVRSPRDGIVMEKMAVAGQMADAGMKLYRIADLATVWVLAQVYEQDLPLVKLGQEAAVTLAYLPDRTYRGRVTYIYPSVDEKTRTAKVRIELHNPGYQLKPGMFASVTLTNIVAESAVLVPDSAVLRSGETNTVFVALDGGKFKPRTVTLGLRADGDQYQVLSGLSGGEKIVTSGQFLLDSESQLRATIAKMGDGNTKSSASASGEREPPGTPEPQLGQKPPPEGGTTNRAVPVSYICPMPEHLSITYQQPGNCPLCGMALVPVTAELLAQIQPGAAVDHYTCPMPEHADVHEAKPGKCPKCGMTLVPVMKLVKAEGKRQQAESDALDKHAPPAAGSPNSSSTLPSSVPPLPSSTLPSSVPPLPSSVLPSFRSSVATPAAWYVCPMPEDNVRQNHPGKCPKCGMKLVPEKK